MISVSNISFSYNDNERPIIRDLSLEIGEGEFVSLIGANGSGKSTLAMLMGGGEELTSGTILIDDLDINSSEERAEAKQKIAVISQNPSEHIVAGSVESDLAFSLENYGIEPDLIRERVDEALSIFNLSDLKDKHPRELSGGEQQKVAFAGIWTLNPNYIICDEVTTFLDYESRTLIIKMLKEFTDKGGGVLFITQFPMESLESERLLVLNDGKIYQSGVPSELIRDESILNKSGHYIPAEIILDELTMNNENGIF